MALNTPSLFTSPSQTAQRNSYIVLQPWEAKHAAELKAANPDLTVLAYQDLSAMAQSIGPGGLSSSGINYAEANSAHPDWFLLNTSGNRISESGYSWLWMADTANLGYQQQWTSNVLKVLSSGPWDGVMMDDTNTTARYYTDPSSITKYPTDAAYQSAIRSILAYAGPRIQAAGKLAIPNMGSWSEYPEVVKEWLQYVSGGMDEMFVKWSTTPGQGYRGASEWQTQLDEIASTEAMGKQFLAITHVEPGDTQAVRYGWASALLGANGHTVFFAAYDYTGETWSSEYEVPLGAPTSVATKIAGGAWKRTFTGGLVVVNPTTTAVSVSFGGSYSGSGLTNATGATLGANSAVILTGEASKSEEKGSEGAGGTGTSEAGAKGTGSSEAEASGTGSSGTSTSGTSTPTGGTTTSTPVIPVSAPTPTKPGRHHRLRSGSKAKATTASVRAALVRCRRGAAAARRRGRPAGRRTASCTRTSTTAAKARTKRRTARRGA
jgi:hypothetical protein